jgi:hypothetical protein
MCREGLLEEHLVGPRHGLRNRRRGSRGREVGAMSARSSGPPAAVDEGLAARADPHAVCARVLAGVPGSSRALLLAVGETMTTAVFALGRKPIVLWRVPHDTIARARALPDVRAAATAAVGRARLAVVRGAGCEVVGASWIARVVVTLAATGAREATLDDVRLATDLLASAATETHARRRERLWIRPALVGAAVIEATMIEIGAARIVTKASESVERDAPATRDTALVRA